jgi:hypothetical protein
LQPCRFHPDATSRFLARISPRRDFVAGFYGIISFSECFRVDAKGKMVDTQYRLVSRESAYAKREQREDPAARNRGGRVVAARCLQREPQGWSSWAPHEQQWRGRDERRVDPAYFSRVHAMLGNRRDGL